MNLRDPRCSVVCIYYFRISIEVFVYTITELGPRRRGRAEISRERHTRTSAKSESSRAPGVSFFTFTLGLCPFFPGASVGEFSHLLISTFRPTSILAGRLLASRRVLLLLANSFFAASADATRSLTVDATMFTFFILQFRTVRRPGSPTRRATTQKASPRSDSRCAAAPPLPP